MRMYEPAPSCTSPSVPVRARPCRRPGRPAAGQAGGRRLRVVAGPDAGVVFALPGTGTVTIGRTADNDVQLTGTEISRRHAALRVGPGGVEVSDTGSSNGTPPSTGRGSPPLPRLRAIVAELLAAGFDALELAAATQALELAGAGFTGSPTELLAKVRPFS
ncbi:FHA domain-containing protein [Dactylosporangium sp. NPDC000521]|uniref:FHA domain-containing protein n=1 Tax=Dactylosporangium sp. NPDC000521 TaxID=3363975 RepID=UPI0036A69161